MQQVHDALQQHLQAQAALLNHLEPQAASFAWGRSRHRCSRTVIDVLFQELGATRLVCARLQLQSVVQSSKDMTAVCCT